MTRTFTTFIAPAVFATAVLAGNAAGAAYTPEAERILDVVAQTGTTITHKVCTGEDKGSYGFYSLHTDDDGKGIVLTEALFFAVPSAICIVPSSRSKSSRLRFLTSLIRVPQ